MAADGRRRGEEGGDGGGLDWWDGYRWRKMEREGLAVAWVGLVERMATGSPFVRSLDSQLSGVPVRTISVPAHRPFVVEWHKPTHDMKMNVDGSHRSNSA
ncbi:hypothetical protein ACH5RR_039520 [Cinchona calisaya]|uniref:Uncharacterized protein n=1 Tax=Cinchona calisaya TaxID=153742 RepID=A0ABD2XYH1_9GENT